MQGKVSQVSGVPDHVDDANGVGIDVNDSEEREEGDLTEPATQSSLVIDCPFYGNPQST